MEFKDVFGSVALVFVVVFFVLSFTSDINSSWGTTIGEDFRADMQTNNDLINETLRNASGNVRSSAQAEDGQNPEDDSQQNILRRGWTIINNIFSFINLPVKLLGVFLDSIPGFPSAITSIIKFIFTIAYYLTLGYLLITGRRAIF